MSGGGGNDARRGIHEPLYSQYSLAPVLVDLIYDVIREIKSGGATILLVEQNAYQALRVADRAYVLETGRIVLGGAAADLRDHPEVKRAYLGA